MENRLCEKTGEMGFFSKISNFIEKTFKITLSKKNCDDELYQSFQEMCYNKG